LHGLRIYVGILAGTILIIAANAGVIGSSRITYAMASYRQIPEVFRRLHPRFKTPFLSLLCFSGLLSIATLLPGRIDFLGTMYSFGAMLSFAIANASLIGLRYRFRDEELLVKGRPNLRVFGVEWPLFSILGLLGTAAAWTVVVVQRPTTRWVGFGWLAAGFATFVVYRMFVVKQPLRATVRAPLPTGPAAVLEYRSLFVPLLDGPTADDAMDVAARLATERGATIVAAAVIEVPLELPLDARLSGAEEEANARLDRARLIGESYGLRVIPRLLRARSAGRELVDEAIRRNAEIVVMGAPRRLRRRSVFDDAAQFVLEHAPTRVMVVAPRSPVVQRAVEPGAALAPAAG
jgi:APA family basic amino acid/polyamine antiporter